MEHKWSEWPRLYLDAGELIRIGDGKVDAGVVSDLVTAASTKRVFLVLSIEHLQDAVPRVDAASRARLADAIERFTFRAIVTKSPTDIEPWESEVRDIEIEPASNIREVINAPAAGPRLGDLCYVQDAAHTALAKVAPLGATKLSNDAVELSLACLHTLIRGRHEGDLNSLVEHWEEIRNLPLDTTTRAEVVARLRPMHEMLQGLDHRFGWDDGQRDEMVTTWHNGYDSSVLSRSPGLALATKLSNAQVQHRRVPQRSDSVDGMHARHFPYVDIATCDGFVFQTLEKAVKDARGSRTVKLIRNGRLEEVTAAILAL